MFGRQEYVDYIVVSTLRVNSATVQLRTMPSPNVPPTRVVNNL